MKLNYHQKRYKKEKYKTKCHVESYTNMMMNIWCVILTEKRGEKKKKKDKVENVYPLYMFWETGC